MDAVSHRFGATPVLTGVELEVSPGEVVALLGVNGAGKSTVIKLLAGVHRPTAGRIVLGGHVFEHGLTPTDARDHGVAFIHQDLGLLGDLTVAENIAYVAGFTTTRGLISWRRLRMQAAEILERWELALDPQAPVKTLEAAERSLVAIARALACEPRVLVFDEPTAALPSHRTEVLFAAIDRLRRSGVGVLYVTHRLDEVERLADRVVVLRDGCVVGAPSRAELTRARLIELILGSTADEPIGKEPQADDEVALRLDGAGAGRANAISFELRRGEVLALVGLVGSGQHDAGRMISGVERLREGSMWLDGAPYAPRSPRDAQFRGVAYLPPDRVTEGAFGALDVGTNLTLRRGPVVKPIRPRRQRARSAALLADYGVTPADPQAPFASLSGGNQQKALLAKWLTAQPRVLVADEPMGGVDVGARRAIRRRITGATRDGLSVALISSDVDEVIALAHRAVVFAHGTIVAELRAGELTADRITLECFRV
jgi:ribose transport system ATP-binding protein